MSTSYFIFSPNELNSRMCINVSVSKGKIYHSINKYIHQSFKVMRSPGNF